MTATETEPVWEFRPLIPDGFEGEPVDVVDALRRARAATMDEGRWMRSDWFRNDHPEVDPEDPYCNDWRACAEGLVHIVTIGMARRTFPVPEVSEWLSIRPRDPYLAWRYPRPEMADLYLQAIAVLRDAGETRWGVRYGEANQYNDKQCSTRTEVVGWFDDAIALAEERR